MANAYKHIRYFEVHGASTPEADGTRITFTSVDDAKTKIGFKSVWNTSSPTITEELADGTNQLKVTYEFDNIDQETAFKSAVDGAYNENDPFVYQDRDFIQDGKNWKIKDGKPGAGTVVDLDESNNSGSHTFEEGATVTSRSARIAIARQTATGQVGMDRQNDAEAFWAWKPKHVKTEWLHEDGSISKTENL